MKRQITTTKKEDGVITAICNPGELWTPVNSNEVIFDIEYDLHQYYVKISTDVVDIHVVDGEKGKYFRTDPDKTGKYQLHNHWGFRFNCEPLLTSFL